MEVISKSFSEELDGISIVTFGDETGAWMELFMEGRRVYRTFYAAEEQAWPKVIDAPYEFILSAQHYYDEHHAS